MSTFAKLSSERLSKALAESICPRLELILSSRGAGHCMRVTDLDTEVMELVCIALRKASSNENIFILCGNGEAVNHITLRQQNWLNCVIPMTKAICAPACSSLFLRIFAQVLKIPLVLQLLKTSLSTRYTKTSSPLYLIVFHIRLRGMFKTCFHAVCKTKILLLMLSRKSDTCSRRWKMVLTGKRLELPCTSFR